MYKLIAYQENKKHEHYRLLFQNLTDFLKQLQMPCLCE
ncbi:hypothetical protein B835_1558 [Enterococcus mundtii 3F]|nr:hypothetical protein [Enterococcus mundtii 3F]